MSWSWNWSWRALKSCCHSLVSSLRRGPLLRPSLATTSCRLLVTGTARCAIGPLCRPTISVRRRLDCWSIAEADQAQIGRGRRGQECRHRSLARLLAQNSTVCAQSILSCVGRCIRCRVRRGGRGRGRRCVTLSVVGQRVRRSRLSVARCRWWSILSILLPQIWCRLKSIWRHGPSVGHADVVLAILSGYLAGTPRGRVMGL